MRWLRWRRPSRDPEPVTAADLELALETPRLHLAVLFALAQTPAADLYDRAVTQLVLWPPRRWFQVDAARLQPWYGLDLTPRRGWRAVLADADAPVLLLVLGSTHRDGHLREAATRALAGRREPLSAAALAVRAVDHVAEVRAVAHAALLARPTESAARVALPILQAARGRQSSGDLLDRYAEALAPEAFKALLRSDDRETRRYAAQRARLSLDELVCTASSNGDLRVRQIAAARALAKDAAVATTLLELQTASIRALALTRAPDSVVLAQLEQLLLERSTMVRRTAQDRGRTLGHDAQALYRTRLPQRTAVLGLAETGARADAALLEPLVRAADTPAVRRAAVIGVGKLAAPEALRELLPPLIFDDEPGVAREAVRQLRRIRFRLTGPDLDRGLHDQRVWTRRAALALAVGAHGWDAPGAALVLFDDEDERLRAHARETLTSWLRREAVAAGSPSAEQAARIEAGAQRLERTDPWLARVLRFHAGIRG